MTTSQKPILHGRDHAPGGADPAPTRLIGFWSGAIPSTVGAGAVVICPYLPNGGSLDFVIRRIHARVETPTAATVLRIEKSAGGGAFSASTVGSATLPLGTYEALTTGLSYAVSSGDLLRIYFVTIGSTGTYFVQLLGDVV